jgi:phage tail-like protein
MAVNGTNFHLLHIPNDSAVFSGADVNGTKFHLLLNRADWGNCTSESGELLSKNWNRDDAGESDFTQEFDWNDEKNEILLQPRLFKFTASPKDEKPKLENRRGAASDRYGNWFWIDETGLKIKVYSTGSMRVSDFYPTAGGDCKTEKSSGFAPVEIIKQTPVQMRGLAVTIDHYLIVGTIQPAGLLIFDLFSVGEPRRILWREDIAFAPFDIAARTCGGAFVLDRANKRYWTLDRGFNAVGGTITADETADTFQPFDESETRKQSVNSAAENFFSPLPPNDDPMAIEALPDDTVLILNLEPKDAFFSVIKRFYRGRKLDELNTGTILPKIEKDDHPILSPPGGFRLRGYDFAFLKGAENERDRLYIVAEEGNQAFAFNLICKDDLPIADLPSSVVKKNFELQPVAEYFPMRLFGGKGLRAGFDGKVYFDCGERFLPLVKQNRPQFILGATLDTPVFDGKEATCVWHRLLLDGCLPAETQIEIHSRAAATRDELSNANWLKEPHLYLRGNGSEQPFINNQTSKESGRGTWELLLQKTANRYLQLRLVFSGNGQRTPRVLALRVYYPRFSYLNNYLPAIYREDDQSAFFLDRFLANYEGFYTTIEERIAAVQMLFDVRSAPSDALDWLANWFGIALDPTWTEDKRRLFISRAVDFYQYRGTVRGLRMALRLALDECADERIFAAQTAEEKRRDPIRIVERFQTRQTPELIPADGSENRNLPRLVQKTAKWQPSQGADVLHQRYRERFENQTNLKFPLTKPDDADEAKTWENFALGALGFVPSGAAAIERRNWQNFLRGEYQNITALNQKHGANYFGFDEIFLPNGTETNQVRQVDWQEFVETNPNRQRKLWQDFLARRYRRVGELKKFYATNWKSFDLIALFDRLPVLDKPLADWFQFESAVLAMHRTAHRFTVLIPATLGGKSAENATEQARKLELVRRVVEMEKPAHTICDFRYYWNLFRVGEVRLGLDTLLGLGSRDPQLNPDLILGQSFAGESRLGVPQPEKYASRYVLGSEDLKQK